MSDDTGRQHRFFAVTCFNECWAYIEKSERSEEDTAQMIRLAETSFWHWSHVPEATERNRSVGNRQLSRVYALANRPVEARRYAAHAISHADEGELPPFFLAYGHEAMARALKCAGDREMFETHLARAYELYDQVDDEESRDLLLPDLEELGPRPA